MLLNLLEGFAGGVIVTLSVLGIMLQHLKRKMTRSASGAFEHAADELLRGMNADPETVEQAKAAARALGLLSEDQ